MGECSGDKRQRVYVCGYTPTQWGTYYHGMFRSPVCREDRMKMSGVIKGWLSMTTAWECSLRGEYQVGIYPRTVYNAK